MPVIVGAETRRLDQEDFGRLAYEVMRQVFEIHHEVGRFFHESIYQRLLASLIPNAQIEVPVTLSHGTFEKTLFIDLLVDGAAIFELKTAAALNGRHRAQLLNYLLLSDLPHGKLVNLRPESVEHEFVNTTLRRSDRTRFEVQDDGWLEMSDGTRPLKPLVVECLRDWGTCLSLALYEEALTHFLGGQDRVRCEVDVMVGSRRVGSQVVRLACPGVAFKVTAIPDAAEAFEAHARRFLAHTRLDAIQWINVALDRVTFKTIRK